LRLHETGSSDEQREALARGDVHIAQAALDNGVAMARALRRDGLIEAALLSLGDEWRDVTPTDTAT